MNTQGTDGGSITVGLPDFASEAIRRGLIAKRVHFGAYTPAGHRCSNLAEINDNLRGATGEQRRHLMASMVRQAAELEVLAKTTPQAEPHKNIHALDLARLREVLNYDPLTGILTWRIRLSPMCKFGEPAGLIKTGGYRKITIDGLNHTASHLAWFHHYGVAPEGLIDHKDLDKDNNRIENLRLASYSENARNRKRSAQNTTGLKGAGRFSNSDKFRSTIYVDGTRVFLGQFDTAEEAHTAYVEAARKHYGEFARTD